MVVARDSDAYGASLASLLPPGQLWPAPGSDPVMDGLLQWIGRELAKIDARMGDLIREADPRQATEMLPDWEFEVGLPDTCSGLAVGIDARRAQVVQKLRARGGASRAYFIGLAAALGYPGATVTEFKPFTCRSACTDGVNGPAWWWTWRLNIPSAFTVRRFGARSACNEPLRSWGDAALECVIRRLKPAHTHVLFGYPEAS